MVVVLFSVVFFSILFFFQFESSEFSYVDKHYLQEHNVCLFTLAFHNAFLCHWRKGTEC